MTAVCLIADATLIGALITAINVAGWARRERHAQAVQAHTRQQQARRPA